MRMDRYTILCRTKLGRRARLSFLYIAKSVPPRNDAPSNSWQRLISTRKRAMRTVEVEERNWTSYVRSSTQNEHGTLSRMCFTFIYRYAYLAFQIYFVRLELLFYSLPFKLLFDCCFFFQTMNIR